MALLSTGPYLFCEGNAGSLDVTFFNNIVGNLGGIIQVEPLGSKYGFIDRIDGYLHSAKSASQLPYIAIRDRDFDYSPLDNNELISIHHNRPIFATCRACVESYLIDAQLIYSYWERLSTSPRRSLPASPTIDELHRYIIEAAKHIAEYQVVRWGLAGIKPSGQHYWPRLKSSWRKDGKLPEHLDFETCLMQAQNFFQKEYVEPTEGMKWGVVEEQARSYQEVFADNAFYANREYLIWFHGKDLARMVFSTLHQLSSGRISQGNYERWAVENIAYNRHNDLRELGQRCEALIQQP